MKLINAHNIIKGGGVNVLTSLVKYIKSTDNEFVLLLPRTHELVQFINSNYSNRFIIIWAPHNFLRFFYKIYFRIYLFGVLKKKYKINKIYSIGNIAIKTSIPQILLIQNAYVLLNDKLVWDRFSFLNRVYLKFMIYDIVTHMKYATLIAVQTKSMELGLIKLFNIAPNRIFIYPNNISISNFKFDEDNMLSNFSFNNGLKLLFLSKYYPHKNFEILPEVCQLLRSRSVNVKIFLTLDPLVNVENIILKKLSIFDDIIVNIGPVSFDRLPETISQFHGFFLPSFIESFSTNYLEAMLCRKLIFTSDRDFATEICGDYGIYFDPFSAHSIVNSFEVFFDNLETKLNYLNSNAESHLRSIYSGNDSDSINANFINFNCESSTY
jgi:glycosyltransferase involved in cell wall biosynthesis